MSAVCPLLTLLFLAALLCRLGDSKPPAHHQQHHPQHAQKHHGQAHAAHHPAAHHHAAHNAGHHPQHPAHHPVAHKGAHEHKAAHGSSTHHTGHSSAAHPHHGHPEHAAKKKKRPQHKRPVHHVSKFGVFANAIDESVKPCDGFFKYTCGKFVADTPNGGADGRASWLNHVQDVVDQRKNDLLMSDDNTTVAAIDKMRTYRDKCLDVAAIELDGPARTADLRADITANTAFPLLDGAAFVPAAYLAPQLTEELHQISLRMGESLLIHLEPFKMSDGEIHLVLMPAQLLLKNYDDYTNAAAASKRQALLDFLTELAQIIVTDAAAAGGAAAVTVAQIYAAMTGVQDFERRLSDAIIAANINVSVNAANIESLCAQITRQDLDTIMPMIDWQTYFTTNDYIPDAVRIELNKPTTPMYIMNRNYFTVLNTLIADDARKTDLVNYLQMRFVIANVKYLDQRFITAAHTFAQQIDGSTYVSNRQQDCLEDIAESFYLVSDHLYVTKWFSEDTRKYVEDMAEDVRGGMVEVFNRNDWLSDASRKAVMEKLKAMRKVIGAVDDAIDPRRLDQRYELLNLDPAADSYRQMGVKVTLHALHRKMMSLVVPEYYTSLELSMRASDVNAAHITTENAIYIPAAITDIVKVQNPAAYNFGMLGFILGHEFTQVSSFTLHRSSWFRHGFDSTGAFFDKDGQPGGDLLDAPSRTEFNTRAQCFIDRYNGIEDPDLKVHVDGQRTLAENIADNGGVRAAFFAYQKHLKREKAGRDSYVRGYPTLTHNQTFFVSMGVAFCDHYSLANRLNNLQTDTHAPNYARIDTALSNFFSFWVANKCTDKPMKYGKDQCRIW
ncbi:hypothetical protein M3Y99_01488800 [Aphelenchoides fujianensis]|nr:hypothetical protein M3Y99_01488800 [Aphelenchoides fujianensis]